MADENDTGSIVEIITDIEVAGSLVGIGVHLRNGTFARLGMTVEAATRLSALLDRARERHGWTLPNAPIDEGTMQ